MQAAHGEGERGWGGEGAAPGVVPGSRQGRLRSNAAGSGAGEGGGERGAGVGEQASAEGGNEGGVDEECAAGSAGSEGATGRADMDGPAQGAEAGGAAGAAGGPGATGTAGLAGKDGAPGSVRTLHLKGDGGVDPTQLVKHVNDSAIELAQLRMLVEELQDKQEQMVRGPGGQGRCRMCRTRSAAACLEYGAPGTGTLTRQCSCEMKRELGWEKARIGGLCCGERHQLVLWKGSGTDLCQTVLQGEHSLKDSCVRRSRGLSPESMRLLLPGLVVLRIHTACWLRAGRLPRTWMPPLLLDTSWPC